MCTYVIGNILIQVHQRQWNNELPPGGRLSILRLFKVLIALQAVANSNEYNNKPKKKVFIGFHNNWTNNINEKKANYYIKNNVQKKRSI